jgi:hypothetical protein
MEDKSSSEMKYVMKSGRPFLFVTNKQRIERTSAKAVAR